MITGPHAGTREKLARWVQADYGISVDALLANAEAHPGRRVSDAISEVRVNAVTDHLDASRIVLSIGMDGDGPRWVGDDYRGSDGRLRGWVESVQVTNWDAMAAGKQLATFGTREAAMAAVAGACRKLPWFR